MKRILLTTALLLSTTAAYSYSYPNIDFLYGVFTGPTSGYVTSAMGPDSSGIAIGEPVEFSSPWFLPSSQGVTFSTPLGMVSEFYGPVDGIFNITPTEEFISIGGGWLDIIIEVSPGFEVSSFGLMYEYTPPSPPAAIPETSTWVMALIGFAWLGYRRSTRSARSSNGEEYPCFTMTRDGFSVLAMGFNGEPRRSVPSERDSLSRPVGDQITSVTKNE
jgi:hypothetical protein